MKKLHAVIAILALTSGVRETNTLARLRGCAERKAIRPDEASAWLFPDPARLQPAGTLKALAFVVVTSLLLYGLVRRQLERAHALASRELEL